MRGLCHHYRVKLHNFAPNTISQAACFVAVCEGYLGISANWDLLVHLFRGELHTLATGETRTRRVVRTGGLTLTLQDTHRELYPPCTMTSNNADREKGWFYFDDAGLPLYTEKLLMGKTDAWHRGVSPPSRQQRLESLTTAAAPSGRRTGGGLDHRQLPPLADRPPHGEGALHL
jgi:hypothetical protein